MASGDGALPQVMQPHAFGVPLRTEGAWQDSPGQRPGSKARWRSNSNAQSVRQDRTTLCREIETRSSLQTGVQVLSQSDRHANSFVTASALHQLARLVEVVVDDRLRVDADGVVDRRQQLARVDRVLERGRSRSCRTCRGRSRA